MSTELEVKSLPVETITSSAVIALVDKLALTPNITKDQVEVIERLLAMQERQDAQRRKESFDAALLRVQKAVPRIQQNGMMVRIGKDGKDGGKIPYAKREDIDLMIRPLYQAEGFTVTWDGPTLPDGRIRVVGRFTCSGHTEEREWVCLPDPSGGKTGPQATSSTIAYGKRQISKMVWDVIETGEDNNGARAEDVTPISQDQADTIRTRLNDLTQPKPGFYAARICQKYRVGKIEDLRVSQHKSVLDDVMKAEKSKRGD